MKTKIWFMLASVIQILVSLYSIITAANIAITEFIMTAKEIVFMSSLNIALNVAAFTIVLKNKIVERKSTLIAICVACFLTTLNLWIAFIALINIIVLASIKRQKQKFIIKDAENALKIDEQKITKKQIGLMIVLLVMYFVQLVPIEKITDSLFIINIFIVVLYVALFIFAILTFLNELKLGLKSLKANFKLYVKYIARVFAVMFVFYIMANMVKVSIAGKSTSVNQESIEALPNLIVVPLAVIWAPIVEETIFRGTVRKAIKNDMLFILVSSVIFGFMHAIYEPTIISVVSTTIQYAVLGGGFAYVYAKTNNIASNIVFHSAYNALGVVLMLL